MKRDHRPYWRSFRTYWYWFAILALLVFQWFMYPPIPGPPARPTGRDVLTEGVHPVQRVVDGDTLLMVGGARVRLEGVDTPETVREDYPVEPWGPEASAVHEKVRSAGRRPCEAHIWQRATRRLRPLSSIRLGRRSLPERRAHPGRFGRSAARLAIQFVAQAATPNGARRGPANRTRHLVGFQIRANWGHTVIECS